MFAKVLVVLYAINALSSAQPRNNNNNGGTSSNTCSSDGLDATYTETITSDSSVNGGKVRNIVASGCPNHLTQTINPNDATHQDVAFDVPAYPCFSDKDPYDVKCTAGHVGVTLNGGVAILSKYAGIHTRTIVLYL